MSLSHRSRDSHHTDHLANEGNDYEQLLVRLDTYIRDLACKNIPRDSIPPEVLDLEVDELAQNVRIKFWLAMRREAIMHHKAYIRRIVQTEVVNMIRKYNRGGSLPLDDDGELRQGQVLMMTRQYMSDPADEVEYQESMAHSTDTLLKGVLQLPSQQQRAVVCTLKEKVDDLLPLVELFANHNLDIRNMNWSQDKSEMQSLRTSLSVARRKLRSMHDEYA